MAVTYTTYPEEAMPCIIQQLTYYKALRKDIYIEQRAGKAARLASCRKMTQPGEFCW
jgi:hypothetical protein